MIAGYVQFSQVATKVTNKNLNMVSTGGVNGTESD